MAKLPISLIVDDGSPVNAYWFHDPLNPHEFLIPPAFAARFAEICEATGIRGKFSVLPMPLCLGRIDRKLSHVPTADLRRFVGIVRKRIAPRFSLTPECLTHFRAYDPETGGFRHVLEDVHFAALTRRQFADYIALALTILAGAGLDPSGVTSPWQAGIDNETEYAAGIGMAFREALHKDRCFYFLRHADEPEVRCDGPETGRVVHVPANTSDPFWETQNPIGRRAACASVRRGIDALLAPDGASGRILELIRGNHPVVLITHWQSLYSDGRAIGLEGLETLARRIGRHLSGQVEWVRLEELQPREDAARA